MPESTFQLELSSVCVVDAQGKIVRETKVAHRSQSQNKKQRKRTRTHAPRKGKLRQYVRELPGRTEVWMRRRLIRRIAPRSMRPIPLPAKYVST